MEENGGNSEERNTSSVNQDFYRSKQTPLSEAERRKIISAGNGNGAAIIGYLAISMIFQDFIFSVLREVYNYGNFALYEFLSQISDTLIYVTALGVSFGLMLVFTKCPVKIALPFRKIKADLLICGVLAGMGVTVIASYIFGYFDNVLYMFGVEIVMPDTGRPESLPAYILYGISSILIPAFVEEMAFRGVVMQSLRRFGDGFALLVSSILFGLCHMNLYQIPYAMLMGLCIGCFVMRSGSLWVGIIIHFSNNAVAFLFEYFLDVSKADTVTLGMANMIYEVICLVLGFFAMLYLVLKYKDMFEFAPAGTVLAEGKKLLYFMISPVMIFVTGAAVYLSAQYINILW